MHRKEIFGRSGNGSLFSSRLIGLRRHSRIIISIIFWLFYYFHLIADGGGPLRREYFSGIPFFRANHPIGDSTQVQPHSTSRFFINSDEKRWRARIFPGKGSWRGKFSRGGFWSPKDARRGNWRKRKNFKRQTNRYKCPRRYSFGRFMLRTEASASPAKLFRSGSGPWFVPGKRRRLRNFDITLESRASFRLNRPRNDPRKTVRFLRGHPPRKHRPCNGAETQFYKSPASAPPLPPRPPGQLPGTPGPL